MGNKLGKLRRFITSHKFVSIGAILSCLGLNYSASFGAPISMVLGFCVGLFCLVATLMLQYTKEIKDEYLDSIRNNS